MPVIWPPRDGWVGIRQAPQTYSTETNGERLEGPIITLAALTPGLDVAAPSIELTDAGLGLLASKSAVGFGLGYFGAKATGTSTTTGDVLAGVTGALALNVGGPIAGSLNKTYPALGLFGSTAVVSGFGTGATELSAQIGDTLTGNGEIDLTKVGYMGLTGGLASLTMGEGALSVGAEYAELGPTARAITDTLGAITTSLGSFVAGRIWNGTPSQPTSVLESPATNAGGLPADEGLISPNPPSSTIP